jgi:outer membrane receptor protein involved in Fe transport
MPQHPSLLIAAVLSLSACAHGNTKSNAHKHSDNSGRRIVTAEAIEQTGARTGWEALQRTVPFFTFKDNNRGGTSRIEHRGRSSITLRDQPMIVMDGVELNDYTTLVAMPASDIEQIEVLSGIDATTYYGTGATKGVIRITTKSAGS